MIIDIVNEISENDWKNAASDLDNYVKFVVDVKKDWVMVGGLRHYQAEELLLKKGSQQEDLWGGGIDLENNQLDFDSMINIRPRDNNASREVLSQSIRDQITKLLKQKMIWKG